jgi:hypothetical protein
MTAEDAVNAILAGFDLGESIIMPSVEHVELFANYETARMQVLTASQTSAPATRYSVEQ